MEQETQQTITGFGCSGWMNSQSLPLIADAKAMITRAQVSWLPIVVGPLKEETPALDSEKQALISFPHCRHSFISASLYLFFSYLFLHFCVFDF